jgi:signal transduction histidine kinase
LVNLIGNAIKFTDRGSVSVKVRQISKSIKDSAINLKIDITDTGIGMDEETLKKIFDSSGRYTRPGTNKEKGSGIGLKLCKDFIELNGGEIFAKSEKGKGSIMGFVINKHIAIL